MSNLPRGWRVKGSSQTSHYYSDLRNDLSSKVADCNQLDAWLEDLRTEQDNTRRCNLCEAKESSRDTLAGIRKAWDTSD